MRSRARGRGVDDDDDDDANHSRSCRISRSRRWVGVDVAAVGGGVRARDVAAHPDVRGNFLRHALRA